MMMMMMIFDDSFNYHSRLNMNYYSLSSTVIIVSK